MIILPKAQLKIIVYLGSLINISATRVSDQREKIKSGLP